MGASALLSSILQIKPILALREGRVEQFGRERTHRRALARLEELAAREIPPQGGRFVTVMHAGAPDQAHDMAEGLAVRFNLPAVPVLELPPAIVTNAGPGVLALGFFVNVDS